MTLLLTIHINTPPCNSPIYQNPLFEYTHDYVVGGASITGGFVYRDCKYTALKGLYICADFSSGNFWTVDHTGKDKIHNYLQTSITTFGEDEDGELYCASIQGNVYKVIDTAIPDTLTLTAIDSPLEGTYRAYKKIIMEDNLDIRLGCTVTLIAPEVVVKDQMNTKSNESLIIKNKGCLD